MLYKTHKAGGALAMLVTFEVMRHNNMLLTDVNPYIQLMMMYPASSWGSTAPDLDHHIESVKERTPFNVLCHKLLHLTHPKHRSWQTHSLIITGGTSLAIMLFVLNMHTLFKIMSPEWVYLRMVVVGATTGIWSHLFMDMLSTGAVHLWKPMKTAGGKMKSFKLRFVPRSPTFGTGSNWEEYIVFNITMLGVIFFFLVITLSMFGVDVYSYIGLGVNKLLHYIGR